MARREQIKKGLAGSVKSDWRMSTIPKHWRGEATLWRAFLYCPFLVVLPAVFGGFWLYLTKASTTSSMQVGVFYTSLVLTLALVAWWAIGLMRTSMRLLTGGYFFTPAIAFLTAVATGLFWVTTLVPEAYELAGVVRKSVAEDREDSARYKKPWSVEYHPVLHRLIASGRIGEGSAKALDTAIVQHPSIKLLELESPGGLISERDQIIEVVQKHHLDTVVLQDCSSACTDVYLAGERRYITDKSTFGFHHSGYRGRDRETVWGVAEHMSGIFFRSRGVKEEFFRKALGTPNADIWQPSTIELRDSGFATNWWSDRPTAYR